MSIRAKNLLIVFTILAAFLIPAISVKGSNLKIKTSHIPEVRPATCTTSDLDHSILVECPILDQCGLLEYNVSSMWPNHRDEILHMFSTRSGDRFTIRIKPNLDYRQTSEQALMNINNTLIVETNSTLHQITGFGVTINPKDLSHPDGRSNREYRAILRDAFSVFRYGLQLNFLVLRLEESYVSKQNLDYVIREVDKLIAESVIKIDESVKFNTIFHIEGSSETPEIMAAIKGIWNALNDSSHLKCWAITIDKDWVFTNPDSKLFVQDIKNMFSTRNLMSVTSFKETGSFIDRLSKESNSFNGLLIKSDFSTPYNVLEYARNYSQNFVIMSIGSTKPLTDDFGDWNNAKNFAVEILNHLNHGSNGFIENNLWTEILTNPTSSDSLIYKLPNDYFRGPMFYALGQFSLHLRPGSRLLRSRVETSPNMFGAKYSAFLTPKSDYVVAVVLNDNPHLLPFQLIIDGVVVSQIDIEPKSINTIVKKL